MSGEVQLKTIADYQAAIKKLDRNKPADLEKIKEYCTKIGEMLNGAAKDGKAINTGSNDIFIRTGEDAVNVKAKNQVPGKEDVEEMKELRDKQNVYDEFGVDENGNKVSDEQVKQLKQGYKSAKKALKEAQKEADKIKYDPKNVAKYNELRAAANEKVVAAQKALADAETRYEKAKAANSAEGGRANRGIRKAAKHNEKNYTNVMNREQVFFTKEEEKAAVAENPELKGHTKVLNEGNVKTLSSMYNYARTQIEEAEKSGSKEKLAAAKERFGDWLEIFGNDEKGNVDYSAIDTKAAQKALMSVTGDDANGNLDEVKVASKQLGVSKGEVKNTLKAFGFGTESALGQKLRNAGISAAAVALTSVIGKTHSHKTAEASASAKGETVQGEINWLASNGEEFNHYYEAKGGDAAVSVVAEACAKIPAIGKIAAPVVAGVTAFLLTKGKTEDAFNGANVEAAMNDLSLIKGKDNKAIVNQIQNMEITGNKGIDDAIKASVIKASIGEDTKSANTEELLAAFKNLQDAKSTIAKIEDLKETTSTPTTSTPTTQETRAIERTNDEQIAKDFTVNHRVGMGPYQYAEALGVPKNHIREFIDQFREDNNMDKAGTRFSKTPVIRTVYEFANGDKVEVPKDKAQGMIDGYNLGNVDPFNGKQHAVNSRAIQYDTKTGKWVYSDNKQEVPKGDLAKHPTYKDYCEKHPDEPTKQGVKPEKDE